MDCLVRGSANISLGIFSNQSESYFEASVGERTFTLRLYVDKKLMNYFIGSR
ncbi:hypothetical protein FEM08_16490 [Flavobacterium gilvum]|nr:hypothetical protein FEM08_16490 [Flavobacterium gilvum]